MSKEYMKSTVGKRKEQKRFVDIFYFGCTKSEILMEHLGKGI